MFHFILLEDSDYIEGIAVNRPHGYIREVVTLSAEDKGSINGASNMELTLVIDATISGSGYALTFTRWYFIQSRGYDKNGYQSIGTDRTYTLLKVILYLSITILLMSIVLMIIWV